MNSRHSKEPLATRYWLSRASWLFAALAAVGITLYFAIPYLTSNPRVSRTPLNQAFPLHFVYVTLHGVPAGLALLLGPVQFIPAIRTRYPAAHRLISNVCLVFISIGIIMGVIAASVSTSGLAAPFGFLLLAAAWFYSGLLAYRAARQHQSALHRVWMIRNYAFTFAAVLLWVLLVVGLQVMTVNQALTFDDVYTTSVWSSILVSYLVAEWFIVQRTLGPLAQKSAQAAESSRVNEA
ncbi:MAG: hypothetical protein AVDCRST_MAG86-2294 [uncultured Truepera sp.]|uniref:DUF2306 domain-containing protein n=1 Tax=uncultured Truepera sp. TaxID=543023 RepID=A0A6J4VG51_9DEIN|nr:MAG: hypothetical protein AVDCRST_MAG86-2294 [uncultured Truepera sp.]